MKLTGDDFPRHLSVQDIIKPSVVLGKTIQWFIWYLKSDSEHINDMSSRITYECCAALLCSTRTYLEKFFGSTHPHMWAGSLEQVYLVDSVCLTYSHKYFLGYTKKINEFKLEQRVALFLIDIL